LSRAYGGKAEEIIIETLVYLMFSVLEIYTKIPLEKESCQKRLERYFRIQ
jgi:hypothetical protein